LNAALQTTDHLDHADADIGARPSLTLSIKEAEGVEFARTYIAAATQMFADEAQYWGELHKHFPNMGRINHSMAYADGDDHTNWVESYFSRLRRMIHRRPTPSCVGPLSLSVCE
jgi:hypothetical protein